jgi:hypothetical protein
MNAQDRNTAIRQWLETERRPTVAERDVRAEVEAWLSSNGGVDALADFVALGNDWLRALVTRCQEAEDAASCRLCHCCGDAPDRHGEILSEWVERCERAEAQRETLELKLAACTTAALGNTVETVEARIKPGHHYWTATYEDVCAVVDREMALREERDRLKGELAAIVEDGTEEHNAAVDLRTALAQARLEIASLKLAQEQYLDQLQCAERMHNQSMAEIDRLKAEHAQHEVVITLFQDFVARERALRDAIGKGGQQVGGYAPSITPSVLKELERIIRDAPDVAANYARLEAENAQLHAERRADLSA